MQADGSFMQLAGFSQGQQPREALFARFEIEAQQNETKSKEAGRPVFDDVEVVEIRIPGDTDFRRRPASEQDKLRFAVQYAAFKAGQDQEVASGTPLSGWAPLSKAQAETARYAGARTVEQLSLMTDDNVHKLGAGWLELRQKARDWLAAAKDGALLSKLRDELSERDRRIATMDEMLKSQGEAIEELRKARKGRKTEE